MESFQYIQNIPQSELEWMQAVIGLSRFLRGHDGRPWDRKASFWRASLASPSALASYPGVKPRLDDVDDKIKA
jgi:hypothetical protein